LRVTLLLTGREMGARLTSVWFFLVASAVCLMALLYGTGFQQSFLTETVVVTADPLQVLNVLVVVFVGLVLGLRLASALAWEKEHRTLEVLLVGPVTRGPVVVAKFLAELGVLVLIVAIYWAYLLLGQPLGAEVIGVADTVAIWWLVVMVLPVMALGLLVSAFMASVRGAVVVFLGLAGVLIVFEAVLAWLQLAPPQELSLTLLYLRSGMEKVALVMHLISAVAYLADLARQVADQTALTLRQTVQAAGLTLATLIAAIWVLRARGAEG
jgi:ABC-type transport system involved in multi-copper enzyme maturation permease subunit